MNLRHSIRPVTRNDQRHDGEVVVHWRIVGPAGPGMLTLRIDTGEARCQMTRDGRTLREERCAPETIEFARSCAGGSCLLVPGVLMLVSTASRTAAYVRSGWVDGLGLPAAALEVVAVELDALPLLSERCLETGVTNS